MDSLLSSLISIGVVDFQFLLSYFRTIFNLRHFGNPAEEIQPFKRFDELRDDLRLKQHKNNFLS